MVRESLFVLIASGLLAACAGDAQPPAAPATPVATESPPPRTPTVFDEQLKALEKAKAVQDTLDKAAADRQKAIDDAGG